MRPVTAVLVMGLAIGASCCPNRGASAQAATAATPAPATARQIAWRDGDVEDAFAEARERNEPVLLYWGAKWCPPCNQLKQGLFRDPAFVAETRNFIAVHLDGDGKDAQQWGARFGIAGYPTVIVLLPDRTEVTRLAGGSMASTLTDVLKLAAGRTTSTEDLLARSQTPSKLSPADWQLLASFDFLDDPRHFGDPAKGSAAVGRLAQAAPDPAMRRHFALTSLLMASGDADAVTLTPTQDALLRRTLPAMLADDAEVKANRQELSSGVAPLILGLPDVGERRRFSRDLEAAMDRIAADGSVPLADRVSSVEPEIVLSKAEHRGTVPPATLAKVRARVAMADREATDPLMRQGVMPGAGQVLIEAGDVAGGQTLWEHELARSVAPYYYMADLAELAESRKNSGEALDWARKGADAAEGPATRIQWAITYSDAVMRLEPDNKEAVAGAAALVIGRLGANSSGYAERTERKVSGWGSQLRDWSARHDGAAVLAQLSGKLDAACSPDRCRNVLKS